MGRTEDALLARVERINDALGHVFDGRDIPDRLREAMAYSLFAGGKRLRPALLMLFCGLAGGDEAASLPYACAIEMIHTYSLIHDDLPAMDDDDLRRGRPTCHKVFGEGMALLAGDGLLSLAFESLLEAARRDGASGVRAALEIARGAGVTGMAAGQCLDIEDERGQARFPIAEIHRRKTGALIRAACLAGAALGNADEALLENARRYGEAFGLAFQITDDILDETGDAQKLGKETGRDRADNKHTSVGEYGVERARQMAREAARKAAEALPYENAQADVLRALAEGLLSREV